MTATLENFMLRCFAAKASLLPYGGELIASLAPRAVEYRAGYAIARKKELHPRALLVLGGWLGRGQDFPSGRRQLIDIHVPGEMVFCGRRHAVLYLCLTDVKCVDVSDVIAQAEAEPSRYPGIMAAFRAFSADSERRLIEQIVRLGAMRAVERMANFALDLYQRLDAAGLCQDGRFSMALSQEEIGCLLGISAVHVNRTLQQLKHMNLIKRDQDRWMIVDRARLLAISEEQNRSRHSMGSGGTSPATPLDHSVAD